MISPDQSLWLAAIVAVAVVVSLLAEKLPVGKFLSGALIVMCLGFLLVNFDVIPSSAPVYSYIYSIVVPVALPLFLYEAKWRAVAQETGRLIYLFFAGAVGVVLGALLAAYSVDVGPNAIGWASVFAASYIGGTMNFVAVSSALELPGQEVAVALAADTLVGMCFLLLLVILPTVRGVSRFYPEALKMDAASRRAAMPDETKLLPVAGGVWARVGFAIAGVGVSVGIFLASNAISAFFGIQDYKIFLVTIIALLLANLFPNNVSRLRPSYGLGVFGMLAFFFVIGASANLSALLRYGTAFAFFIAIIVIVHFIVVLLVARIFRYRMSELVITSCACALGPTVAAGIAASKQWKALVTPGVLLGVLGYAVANFVGLTVALMWGG